MLSKQSVAVCHEVTLHEARHQGWTWPASYSATRKWLATYDNLAVSFLLRNGRDAWCRRFMPHIEIDYTLIDPGQMFQTDHSQLDAWVDHEGTQLRPWLTVVPVIFGIVKGHSASRGGLRVIAQLTADRKDLKSDRMVPWLTSLLLGVFSLARFFWKTVISESVRLISRTSPSMRMKWSM